MTPRKGISESLPPNGKISESATPASKVSEIPTNNRKACVPLSSDRKTSAAHSTDVASLREQLLDMAEPGYRDFVSPLMPGVEHVIGIRIPILRGIAREIARGDWQSYLAQAENLYFEERLLQGLVIGYAKCSAYEKLAFTARFVPKIDNWAVCDCFCWKLRREERAPMWEFIQPYLHSDREYDLRFGVVMALGNFVDEEHIDRLLPLLDAIRHEGYYARMAVAWALSVCFVKFPQRTMAYLRHSTIDKWTFNKTLQKICESYRVSADDKTIIRTMRRR